MSKYLNDEFLKEPEILTLGILGSRKISSKDLQECILTPILQELGRLPDRILIPTENTSSIYIQDWAESLHITYQIFQADWKKIGRSAGIIRDDRIQKDSSHLLIFLPINENSCNKKIKLAEKLVKKGKKVFTSSYQDLTLELQELCEKASEPVRKSNNGTMLSWLKSQK